MKRKVQMVILQTQKQEKMDKYIVNLAMKYVNGWKCKFGESVASAQMAGMLDVAVKPLKCINVLCVRVHGSQLTILLDP